MGMFILALLLSFVPALLYALLLYSIDRFEKEPLRLVIGCFLWGAIIAAGGAFIGNTAFGLTVYAFTGDEKLAAELGSVLSAPVLEELVKGAAVLGVFLRFRHEFDTVLDGVVYAGITALGFAATENVLYLYVHAYLEQGTGLMLGTFFARVVLAGWLHPIFTACFGIGLAFARLSRDPFTTLAAPVAGLLLAMVLHATHNGLVTYFSTAGWVIALLIHWVEWVAMALVIAWALLRQRRWLRQYLPDEVARGTLSDEECRAACSLRGNFHARRQGPLARRLFRTLTRLAISKHHAALGHTDGAERRVEQLRVDILALRAQRAHGAG
ncbi:MAG: PrsW family intramembrane metalloprotease [Planctomycetota bacterium]|nr:PrsW family intramembrane metalloprotease [Planctomycetota bacterium]